MERKFRLGVLVLGLVFFNASLAMAAGQYAALTRVIVPRPLSLTPVLAASETSICYEILEGSFNTAGEAQALALKNKDAAEEQALLTAVKAWGLNQYPEIIRTLRPTTICMAVNCSTSKSGVLYYSGRAEITLDKPESIALESLPAGTPASITRSLVNGYFRSSAEALKEARTAIMNKVLKSALEEAIQIWKLDEESIKEVKITKTSGVVEMPAF
ncbi:MAG: hypothetical protein PHW04_08450 [Candidatus Wallbacteria bacterium]|nr:hypothetical protein [Candidatus Wallbacteria bacterium]